MKTKKKQNKKELNKKKKKQKKKKNRMFVVKLNLKASQCDDIGRKHLNKQLRLSRGYTEQNII